MIDARHGWGAFVLPVLLVSGCGGGSSDPVPGAEPAGETVPDTALGEPANPLPAAERGGPGLTLVLDPGCTVPGEAVQLRMRSAEATIGVDDDSDERRDFGRNVTGYTAFEHDAGAASTWLPRDDEAVGIAFSRPRQASITGRFAGDSKTRYLSAYPHGAPGVVILRTQLAEGCLLSLRLPSNGYCPTVRWRGRDLRLGLGERTVTASGTDCELDNPNGYPVIDLP